MLKLRGSAYPLAGLALSRKTISPADRQRLREGLHAMVRDYLMLKPPPLKPAAP